MQADERQEWLQSRCGCVGASRIGDVMAKPIKGAKEATTRRNYKAELVCERLTGKVTEQYQSWDMKRGIELEPEARSEYESTRKVRVDTSGFVRHTRIANAGATPDGLIGEDGLVQFKAPKLATHQEWLMSRKPPTEYQPQMLWEMACAGRQWCDFVSYHPDMPPNLQLFVARFFRDEPEIGKIEEEVIRFNAEVEERLEKLQGKDDTLEKLTQSVEVAKQKKLENSLYITENDIA